MSYEQVLCVVLVVELNSGIHFQVGLEERPGPCQIKLIFKVSNAFK